ncbi:hypothetical protein Mapa_005550 [Marchantia paleacea]|nr:hypothetical protein Mapa_005550 [Marchantia paleacea]
MTSLLKAQDIMSQTWGNGLPIRRLIICRGPAFAAVPLTSVACFNAKTKRFSKSVRPSGEFKAGLRSLRAYRKRWSQNAEESRLGLSREGAGRGADGVLA